MHSANYFLNEQELFQGEFIFQEGKWIKFDKKIQISKDSDLTDKAYVVPFHPIDIHCHGIDKYDFSEIKSLDLNDIEKKLQERSTNCIITLFLFQEDFHAFLVLMETFSKGKKSGRYPHIQGIALEGPLLSSSGGTPSKTSWYPTLEQWETLAQCGEKGLLYVVLSPDIYLKGHLSQEKVIRIVEILLEGNVLPAPGHFLQIDPEESGRAVTRLLECVAKRGKGPTISDHLYNDMPKNFIHAWRTPSKKAKRQEELKHIDLPSWNRSNFKEKLGPIPAALMEGALQGLIKLCLNFDGEHVDLEVAKRTVEILGTSNLIAMTDRVEVPLLGRQKLKKYDHSTLFYLDQDIVAAGSNTIDNEIENMRKMGLTEMQIWDLFAFVPKDIFKSCTYFDEADRPLQFTFVSQNSNERQLRC